MTIEAVTTGAAARWSPMKDAPRTTAWVRVLTQLHDGTCAEYTAHWAEDLSGEEQPPFSGWFYAVRSNSAYDEVPGRLLGWQPITQTECEFKAFCGKQHTTAQHYINVYERVIKEECGVKEYYCLLDAVNQAAKLRPLAEGESPIGLYVAYVDEIPNIGAQPHEITVPLTARDIVSLWDAAKQRIQELEAILSTPIGVWGRNLGEALCFLATKREDFAVQHDVHECVAPRLRELAKRIRTALFGAPKAPRTEFFLSDDETVSVVVRYDGKPENGVSIMSSVHMDWQKVMSVRREMSRYAEENAGIQPDTFQTVPR